MYIYLIFLNFSSNRYRRQIETQLRGILRRINNSRNTHVNARVNSQIDRISVTRA